MLIQKRLTTQRKVLYIALAIALVGVGVFAWLQLSSPTTLPSTNAFDPARTLSLRPIPDIHTEVLRDERLLDTLPFGPGRFTDQLSITPRDNDIPASPAGVRVHDSSIGELLVVFWELPPESGAEGIRVYRSTALPGPYQMLGEVAPSETYYEDEQAVNGTEYFYVVKACKRNPAQTGSDTSPFCGSQKQAIESEATTAFSGTATDTVAPDEPTNITLENLGDGASVLIRWQNPTNDDFSHVAIYRSEIPGELGALVRTDLTGTQYTDDALTSGLTYYYTLVAFDTNGNQSSGLLYLTSGNRNPFQPIVF